MLNAKSFYLDNINVGFYIDTLNFSYDVIGMSTPNVEFFVEESGNDEVAMQTKMNAVSVMSSHGLSSCQTVFVPDLNGPVLEADDDAVGVCLDVEHL